MNHPSAEQWMAYLYNELPRAEKASLSAHLKSCAQCQESIVPWRKAMTELSRWKVPAPPTSASFPREAPSSWKWAMAAVLVLGLGFAVGRFFPPTLNAAGRASLAAQLQRQVQDQFKADWQAVLSDEPGAINSDFRRQLRSGLDQWAARTVTTSAREQQRLLTEVLQDYQANRQQDRQSMISLLNRSEQRHDLEHVRLRRSIETVAVVAADKFQRTDTQLGQLASYAQAKFVGDDSDEPLAPVHPSNLTGNK